MRQRLIIIHILLLFAVLGLYAQELTVKSFSEAVGDLSARASENRRTDRNGDLCGLVKVQLPLSGVTFDGSFIIGDVQRKPDGYWVYMSKGSYQLHIMHPSFHPLELNLRELQPAASSGFRGVQPLMTYKLVVNVPTGQVDADDGMRFMVLRVEPKNSTVFVDDTQQDVMADGTVRVQVTKGFHTYRVSAPGYGMESKQVEVGDSKLDVRVVLHSTKATLNVSCATSGAQIFVNGQLQGSSP